MKLRPNIKGPSYVCTDCKATLKPDDNTADGVIYAWDEEFHDCPYCTVRERKELTRTDMTGLPDFGAF